ncbi:MAG: polysaccharide deacetylase family protein [Gemmatimonadales bacterium]|jgi:peptidoglycan/xylan/chitin deacetylase (PgdA/CDA1 family)|nr:MAG: polysaccharide deacetylase family protein [Gemmatimonadales bacterium]
MIPVQTRLRQAILSGLYHTRSYRLLEPRTRGVGAIFTLHHVRPARPQSGFSPNRILEITPDFLIETIKLCQRTGHEFVSLDEARRRLLEGAEGPPFVSFTLDDGYADNYLHAFPIFREHGVPFTIYLCPGLMEERTRHWWLDLEDIVAANDLVEVEIDGVPHGYRCATDAEKRRSFETVYWALRRTPHEGQMESLARLTERYLPGPVTRPPMLSGEMVDEMRGSGLFTPGAHTMTHPALAKLGPEAMRAEMDRSREWVRERYGEIPRHVAYPYGDMGSAAKREFEAARELGFDTGVTTRKGVLYPEHGDHLQALPRISLNGDYQKAHYVELFLTGVAFWLQPGLPRLNVS